MEERFEQFKLNEANFLFDFNKIKEINYDNLMKLFEDLQNILSFGDSKYQSNIFVY